MLEMTYGVILICYMSDRKTPDQQKADSFLEDFVGQLARFCGSDIDFILLFGSAARGEFILGKSDVDLVIQVKSDGAVQRVEQFAEPLFWRLDDKHGMHFKRVVSTGEAGSFLEAAVKWLEKQARLYKPFEVFGPDDIDWRAGKVKRLDLLPGAVLVASQLTLFYKMKHEGKILLGRDIRPGDTAALFRLGEAKSHLGAAEHCPGRNHPGTSPAPEGRGLCHQGPLL